MVGDRPTGPRVDGSGRAHEDGRRAQGAAQWPRCGHPGDDEGASDQRRRGAGFPDAHRSDAESVDPRKALQAVTGTDATMHGTARASFRTWTAERSDATRDVAEMCLAHRVGSDIERSYARSDLFDRRRRLVGDWATYVTA